jgi:hypothetical protein
MPFPYVVVARLGAKPLEPFGKGSNALKAGTRDAGPVRSYRAPIRDTAVRSAPGRGRAEARYIRGPQGNASARLGAAVVVERCEARALPTRLSVRVRQVWLLAGPLRGCLRQQGAAVIVEPW